MGNITVTNLGKAYKQYSSRWSRLAEWILPGDKNRHSLKWVLQNINFTIRPGEATGIIGINGAGKSTLLKIITGTTQQTSGSITVTGRIAAMLELGMGFHPDFTGRQNVYMAGQLLGYSIYEISRLMPEIEGFAEIGEYIDLPVRVYSSGMQVRLAFSVATASRPDILIVDEALSVGDTYFQHKSFNRIQEFSKSGTTLLIVSHDKEAIQSICDRAILINGGTIAMEGEPEAVMDYYNALLADHQTQTIFRQSNETGKIQTVSGTGEATISSIFLVDSHSSPVEVIDVGQLVRLHVEVTINSDINHLVFGYGIKDRFGQLVYGTNTELKKQPLLDVRAGSRHIFDISFKANLGPGTYSIQTALSSSETHLVNNYEWRELALVFNIVNLRKEHFVGCAWLDPTISIRRNI